MSSMFVKAQQNYAFIPYDISYVLNTVTNNLFFNFPYTWIYPRRKLNTFILQLILFGVFGDNCVFVCRIVLNCTCSSNYERLKDSLQWYQRMTMIITTVAFLDMCCPFMLLYNYFVKLVKSWERAKSVIW